MDPAVAGIPADRRGDVAVAELRERSTFGRVGLADVVVERPKLLGVAFGKCGEDATGADCAELAVVATTISFAPDRSTAVRSRARSTSEVGTLIEDQHVPVRDLQGVVVQSPGE